MIPGILAACPTLERYRTLSHNTLEALGLPRRPFRVKSAVLTVGPGLPVYRDEQTFSLSVGKSQSANTRSGNPDTSSRTH
jgi:hypothetical protein